VAASVNEIWRYQVQQIESSMPKLGLDYPEFLPKKLEVVKGPGQKPHMSNQVKKLAEVNCITIFDENFLSLTDTISPAGIEITGRGT
jgi:hypothetical protein